MFLSFKLLLGTKFGEIVFTNNMLANYIMPKHIEL